MPTATLDSRICFNEVTFGFVPHGGTSYYLSRLPGEIGTFLGVTGLPITGIDAVQFRIADKLVHLANEYEQEVIDIVYGMEFPIPSGYLRSDRLKNLPWVKKL
jgi:enoyl-CoA hydratase/carnithine racemase